MPIKHKHSIIDYGRRPEILELFIRIKYTRAKFKTRQVARADQNRPLYRGRNVDLFINPEGIGCWQRLAGYAVVTGVDYAFSKIKKPAVFDTALIQILLRRLKLLSPIGIRIGQVLISVRRSSPKFV